VVHTQTASMLGLGPRPKAVVTEVTAAFDAHRAVATQLQQRPHAARLRAPAPPARPSYTVWCDGWNAESGRYSPATLLDASELLGELLACRGPRVRVLDLGCGDGAFLAHAHASLGLPWSQLVGIAAEDERTRHAGTGLPIVPDGSFALLNVETLGLPSGRSADGSSSPEAEAEAEAALETDADGSSALEAEAEAGAAAAAAGDAAVAVAGVAAAAAVGERQALAEQQLLARRFDLIVSFSTWWHLSDPLGSLEHVARTLLSPSGIMLVHGVPLSHFRCALPGPSPQQQPSMLAALTTQGDGTGDTIGSSSVGSGGCGSGGNGGGSGSSGVDTNIGTGVDDLAVAARLQAELRAAGEHVALVVQHESTAVSWIRRLTVTWLQHGRSGENPATDVGSSRAAAHRHAQSREDNGAGSSNGGGEEQSKRSGSSHPASGGSPSLSPSRTRTGMPLLAAQPAAPGATDARALPDAPRILPLRYTGGLVKAHEGVRAAYAISAPWPLEQSAGSEALGAGAADLPATTERVGAGADTEDEHAITQEPLDGPGSAPPAAGDSAVRCVESDLARMQDLRLERVQRGRQRGGRQPPFCAAANVTLLSTAGERGVTGEEMARRLRGVYELWLAAPDSGSESGSDDGDRTDGDP
jgi:SAM-dependent methyltransferase